MSDKKKLVLLGGGGHCKSVLDTVFRTGAFSDIVITDSSIPAGEDIMGCKVVGTDSVLRELWDNDITQACITVGNIKDTKQRQDIYRRAKEIGFEFPSIVDPSAVVSASAQIGHGVFIGKHAVVNTCATIDDMAIINTGALIEHDCRIGSFVHIAVGAVLCGGVEVERDVFVGANATIIQGLKIGMDSVIGAGSLILENVPKNKTIVGTWKVQRNPSMGDTT